MRPLWLHFLLLLLYLFLVFVIFRLMDMCIWYQHGISSTHVVDPLMLSVRQLKQLLEIRGISYTGYVEKKELAELVEASANVLHGEVNELGKERLMTPPTPSHFTGGPHFYEEVEDTKDSVWIVQVVPPQAEPLLDDYSWRVVCSHVAPFAIRTGIFDCNLDRRLCSSKGWNQPLLLLALPKGTRAKDKVILRTFTSSRPQPILEWVRDQLSIRVKKIASLDDLEENWLSKSNNKTSMNESNVVKVLFLSHLLHPPVFLAALSIKFTGRIKFGVFSTKQQDVEYIRKRLKINELKLPTYLIITPEQKVIYGQRKSEHFNFFSMHIFLRAVQPEMNDVFLWSLVTVNMLVFLRIFQISMQLWWKNIAHCVWTIVTYNLWLFSLWLVIIAMYRFPVVSFLIDKSLVLVRYVSLTDIGSLVRADWQVLSHHPYYLLFSFIIFGLIVRRILNIHFPIEIEVGRENDRPWWEVLPVDSYWINFFFQPMATLTRPIPPTEIELEEGIEMLIERLAVPNLWLHPVIPLEYIKDLPVWKFRGWNSGVQKTKDLTTMKQCADVGSPEDIACMMDCQYPSGESHYNSSHCRNCLKEKLKFRHFQSCSYVNHKGLNENMETSKCTSFLKVYSEQNVRLSCNSNSVVQDKDPACSDSDRRLTTADVSGCLSTNQTTSSEDSGDEGSPSGMLPTTECAICLESYTYETLLCGLPCGHSYHQPCIMVWLQRDNHHCPVCRWPAYKSRHLHRE